MKSEENPLFFMDWERVGARALEKKILEHAAELRREEVERCQIGWWFLSFGDEAGFRGACFVRAFGVLDAVDQANMLDINPGSNVASCEVPEGFDIPEAARKRLLSRDDLVRYFGEVELVMRGT